MDDARYIELLRDDGLALAAAARSTSLEARVPPCPDWDVGELVGHIGRVHGWVRGMLETRATERGKRPDPPARDELLAWYEEGVKGLVAALEATEPEAPIWNFGGTSEGGRFWRRRQAQETAVHRWDAQAAAGTPAPIDRELAIDGVDEILDVFLSFLPARPVEGLEGSMHLHATDGDGEWLVKLRPDKAEVTREHAKGDVALRGSASDLLLFLWNRVPLATLEVHGDEAVARRWSDLMKF